MTVLEHRPFRCLKTAACMFGSVSIEMIHSCNVLMEFFHIWVAWLSEQSHTCGTSSNAPHLGQSMLLCSFHCCMNFPTPHIPTVCLEINALHAQVSVVIAPFRASQWDLWNVLASTKHLILYRVFERIFISLWPSAHMDHGLCRSRRWHGFFFAIAICLLYGPFSHLIVPTDPVPEMRCYHLDAIHVFCFHLNRQ